LPHPERLFRVSDTHSDFYPRRFRASADCKRLFDPVAQRSPVVGKQHAIDNDHQPSRRINRQTVCSVEHFAKFLQRRCFFVIRSVRVENNVTVVV
jgi:hypothetical protein